MSKINAIRLVNLNYNNDLIKIDDEIFYMNAESTFLSLRNGGGKSVLVQMMQAPFVHKRYRDTKDRAFESYFKSSKPTFIMVEWKLDQGAGYVLTGMMVRKNQDTSENKNDNLDIINFVSEYGQPCVTDIQNLPVVEKGKKEIILKSYMACKQMFEEYKKDTTCSFSYFDMNNSPQQKQYFEKIKEYQIDYKEWESIINKINQQESGLSNLFSDCKDERGLVEKWFLGTVEEKLNSDKNRIKEFQNITEKYVEQYRDNQSKIQRRDTINLFKEQADIIKEKGKVYLENVEEKKKKEYEIGSFIYTLENLQQNTETKRDEVRQALTDIENKIEYVEYEKLSTNYYLLKEKQNFHISNRNMYEIEKNDIEREKISEENKLHVMQCAKQRDYVKREEEELEEIRQKLEVSQLQSEELIPERNRIGKRLYVYYNSKYEENKKQQTENREKLNEMIEEIKTARGSIAECDANISKLNKKIGFIQGNISNYSQIEDRFNSIYGNLLTRNILGYYEPGFIEIKKKEFIKEYEDNKREYVNTLKNIDDLKEEIYGLERTCAGYEKEENKLEIEIQKERELNEKYEKELSDRKTIIKYLDINEKEVFNTEKILAVSGRKLKEIDNYRKKLDKEIDQLNSELDNLINGKVIDIPEKIVEEFQNIGINIVYGMEWIKKNGFSEKHNRKLIKANPMFPYSIILSAQEVEKLKHNAGEVFTSFPIPIIVREQLDVLGDTEQNNIIDFGDIKFYVLFNEQLLDEKILAESIEKLKLKIDKKKEELQIREKEYNEYYMQQERIRNQEVNKKLFDDNKKQIEVLSENLKDVSEKKVETLQMLNSCKERNESEDKKRQALEKSNTLLEQRNNEFDSISDAYKQYTEFMDELDEKNDELQKRENQKKLMEDKIEKSQNDEKELRIKENNLKNIEKELSISIGKYADYSDKQVDDENSEFNIIELEARYDAITKGMAREIQELEKKMQKQLLHYNNAKTELERLLNKFGCDYAELNGVIYSVDEETHLENVIEDLNKKLIVKNDLIHNEISEIKVFNNKLDDCTRNIKEKCGKDEPLEKSSIIEKDYDKVKNELLNDRKLMQKNFESLNELWQSFEDNLTSLSEYNYLNTGNDYTGDTDFLKMSRKELRDWRGILLRDYRECGNKMQMTKDNLVSVLNQVIRLEEFEDDFYRKPIETMIELSDDAALLLQQLDTTIKSYDSLMEKLEVDISIVEKEQEKIVELMEDYVNEVHINLGKIDSNSTIKIRERPIKMLKINLPEWEENKNIYHVKLVDFIDEITKQSIEIYDENKNPHEFIGTRINTKNLYDMIIGINNVEIKLYKIEEQREYPITWSEVAKNSGGEGFLSAFVILSSLLYYMRKDETDLFAEKNEGKVLIMDNPFAQTNAEHLLKPLMYMAKKANTQLICLSGLGGDTIYNRFDNIYVLNLIDSKIRTGKQYMKVEHKKGNEPDVIVPSHIEVVEQLSLF